MTLDQLRAFVAVVEHGSIRAGARALNLAQSGLTQQVKRLESTLGGELFLRTHSGITLTTQGAALLGRARIILGECDRAEQEFRQSGDLWGTLNVGVSSEAFARLVPPVLRQFHEAHPKVLIHLATGPSASMLAGIREGRLDFSLSLVAQGSDMTDLSSTVLDAAQPCVICRIGHPLESATSIRDLTASKWINTRPLGTHGTPSNRIADWFKSHGLEVPDIVATVESLFDTLNLVAASDYLFLGPRVALGATAPIARLARMSIAEPIPAADICLIQRAGVALSPAANRLAAMTISYARMLRLANASDTSSCG